jgi:hypothetical protein
MCAVALGSDRSQTPGLTTRLLRRVDKTLTQLLEPINGGVWTDYCTTPDGGKTCFTNPRSTLGLGIVTNAKMTPESTGLFILAYAPNIWGGPHFAPLPAVVTPPPQQSGIGH